MNITELAMQAGFGVRPISNEIVARHSNGSWVDLTSTLQTFADLVIKNHQSENYQVRTDNTQLIANMEAKIVEQESKLAIAIEALEKLERNGEYETSWRALEALKKIKGVSYELYKAKRPTVPAR